ncbi:hypothetical protein [Pontibacter akesuensis]|uniref:ABC-2 family transporter protein n=1 Tax=Pontibacter akesuensis TaxID=388950 RepID=A0A1I7KEF5_9BACT|nr:hypothetical protein [Pontibacter akesuensis]GHA79774.1 hypothetical protein GCM10007389_37510 [Pontibacter akesuensis]SFU95891.1 hypothetical protein SAMN04487941_3638 [Pontibacter akesuensis]
MQNKFSFRRFSMLFQKHTSEYLSGYLMAVVVLLGVLILFLGGAAYLDSAPLSENLQALVFALLFFGFGFIFTSGVFASLGDKNKAISFLTLPASHFEKYLVGWIYSFLFFSLVYVACFYLVAAVVLRMDTNPGQESDLLDMFTGDRRMYMSFVFYALLHGLAIFGSAFFKKGHFIKSAFAFVVIMLLIILLNEQVMQLVWSRDLKGAVPFSDITFLENQELMRIAPPEGLQSLAYGIPVVLAVLFWAAAYSLLKEKQV